MATRMYGSGSQPELHITDEVWARAYDLAQRAWVEGITVPATDIVISACAAVPWRHTGEERVDGVELEEQSPFLI